MGLICPSRNVFPYQLSAADIVVKYNNIYLFIIYTALGTTAKVVGHSEALSCVIYQRYCSQGFCPFPVRQFDCLTVCAGILNI